MHRNVSLVKVDFALITLEFLQVRASFMFHGHVSMASLDNLTLNLCVCCADPHAVLCADLRDRVRPRRVLIAVSAALLLLFIHTVQLVQLHLLDQRGQPGHLAARAAVVLPHL